MASIAREIQDKIVTMIRSDSAFASINGYHKGEWGLPVPFERYPLCEVAATNEIELSQDTRCIGRAISGFVRVSVVHPSYLDYDANGVVEIASDAQVKDYIQNLIELFNARANLDLQGLTFAGGGVVEHVELHNDATYGMAPAGENNYENQAVISFTVYTREDRA